MGGTVSEWYLLADGDRVGDRLDRALAACDLTGYLRESREVDHRRDHISAEIERLGGTVLLASADSVLASLVVPLTDSEANKLVGRQWSVGQGPSLAAAHAALAVAKSSGRGKAVSLTSYSESRGSELGHDSK